MKKYHVYGMGAALVDTELEVTDDDLIAMAVDKGMMTLVDEAKQAELLTYLQSHQIQASRASGGSAGNTIIASSYFGGKCFFSGKVADDENGHFYMQDMHAAGVDIPSATAESGVTGKCLILITPDAERSMNTFLGISAELSAREIEPQAIADSQYLYIESYLVTSDSGRAAAIEARQIAQKNGTKVALSFSDPGIIANFSDGVKEIMGGKVDLVFCNQEEAFSFAQVSDLPAAVEKIKLVADQFVITLGAKGALIYDGQELIAIDGVEVDAIDTNGAGDMFAGAFLYSLSQGINHQRGGEFASTAAAKVVTQYGPRLSADEYRSLVKTFFV